MLLSEKLKALRLEHRITLDDLSKKSDVSKSLLSQIERNISIPTVRTLERITKALGITISGLFSEMETRSGGAPLFSSKKKKSENSDHLGKNFNSEGIAVVRKEERKKLIPSNGKVQYELLSPDLQQTIQFIIVHYPVGAKRTEFIAHKGEECGVILMGKLKGFIGSNEIVLKEGDSIYFRSTIPHRWENVGETDVKAIWANTPPSF